jgi:dynein intermediate chain 2
LVGTEQGTIFIVNRKKGEGGEITANKLGLKWGRHLGPVIAMQRCPDLFKFILSIGDWTARVGINI